MSDNAKEPPFAQWCILELMGHVKVAGLVTERRLAGADVLHIEAPAVDGAEAFGFFFGPTSIYRMTPVAEPIARAVAAQTKANPIGVYGHDAIARLLRQPSLLEQRPGRDDEDEADISF